MKRLTWGEWLAVLGGLEANASKAHAEALNAYSVGMEYAAQNWVTRLLDSKSAYDRILMWPLDIGPVQEEQVQEPYGPLYQEPDSFDTYNDDYPNNLGALIMPQEGDEVCE